MQRRSCMEAIIVIILATEVTCVTDKKERKMKK